MLITSGSKRVKGRRGTDCDTVTFFFNTAFISVRLKDYQSLFKENSLNDYHQKWLNVLE